MREAFELSYACAMMFAKARIQLIAMDELAFKHPVPIGSILEYTAQVTFTEITPEGQLVHIEVHYGGLFFRSLLMSLIPRLRQERQPTHSTIHLPTLTTSSNKSFHSHTQMQ